MTKRYNAQKWLVRCLSIGLLAIMILSGIPPISSPSQVIYAAEPGMHTNIMYPPSAFQHNGSGTIIDVTKPPFSADPTGVKDATSAFIAAYDELMNATGPGKVLYVPNGAYTVSDTIVYSGAVRTREERGALSETVVNVRIIGQSRDGVSIKLKDNAPGFQKGANKPLFSFGKGTFNNLPASSFFENITLNTGRGNPGATGLRFHGANNAAIRNVVIRSGDGEGHFGLDLPITSGHGGYFDISIAGFDYGIHKSKMHDSTVSFENVSLNGQKKAGIWVEDAMFSIRKLVSTNTVPAVLVTDARSLVCIIDSELTGGASTNPAIKVDNGEMFARNVKTVGYGNAISKGSTKVVSGTQVYEYKTRKYTLFSDINDASLNLPVLNTPYVPWELNMTQWANVKDYNARGDGVTDDTVAIQNAMNSGKSTIYFPPGKYVINQTIQIPGTVKRVNFMFSATISLTSSFISIKDFSPVFNVVGDSLDPIVIEDLRSGEPLDTHYLVGHGSTRTLVMSDLHLQRGSMYANTVEGGKVFFENCSARTETVANPYNPRIGFKFKGQKVWARYINPEYSSAGHVVAENSEVWVFGFKSESWARDFKVINSKLEVIGGVSDFYGLNPINTKKELVYHVNSSVSFSMVTTGPNNTSFAPAVLIDETRGSQFKTLTQDNVLLIEGAKRSIPLYVSRIADDQLPVLIAQTAANPRADQDQIPTPAPYVKPEGLQLEAENANTFYDAVPAGNIVDYGAKNSYIQFNNINVPEAGTYKVFVYYASADMYNRDLEAMANGVSKGLIQIEGTIDWNYFSLSSGVVQLNAGANTLRLTAITARGGPNVDHIILQKQ